MGQSDENKPAWVQPTRSPGSELMGIGKLVPKTRQQRKALGLINQNSVGAQPVVSKRGLSKKHMICEQKQDLPRRPITRKFAAQIASTELFHPASKKENASISNSICSENYIYVDLPAPMFLEETKEEKDELDHMKEVEMEDIDEEDPIVDIDALDAKNPLAVVEYVEEIYAYFRKAENSSSVWTDYMAQQDDINEKMRAILIDWLITVHDKFGVMAETLFLTVNLIDRFLDQQTVPRKKLQLVGLVALLLACKYEEVYVPAVGDLVLISDNAYTRNEFLEMESLMLNKLQFNMSIPTPYAFMKRFLKAAQSDKKLEVFSFFLIELCLVEYEMLKFAPSLLAASAIYTAQFTLFGFKQWSKTCERHAAYSEDQLLECSRLIVSFHQKAGTGKLTAVHRKYCASKFGYAAKCEPAQYFSVDTKSI